MTDSSSVSGATVFFTTFPASSYSYASVAWFDAALRLNPVDGRTWSGLAMARMLKMDLPGALDAFHKAVANMPGHVGTWITFGWCRFLANDVNGAREAFAEALRLDRNVAENHGALAVVLARLGDTAAAPRSTSP